MKIDMTGGTGFIGGQLDRALRQQKVAAWRHPLNRVGQPSDIAAAARFLLSEQAHWSTG